MFYRAYGNIKHDVYFVLEDNKALEDKDFTKEERNLLTLAQKNSQAMWNKDIYDPSNTKCKSIISMEIKDFSGTLDIIKNTLGLNSGRLNGNIHMGTALNKILNYEKNLYHCSFF